MAAGWHGQGCWAAGAALLGLLAWQPAGAGPVVCATSLEAPQPGGAPVEVTRCGPLTSTSDLVERRFYSYTAPFARGVNLTHQLTDLLGIALGGGDGTRLMGLGFPDQTIVWDGSALEATTGVLLEAQSAPLPWRSPDRSNGFCQGLSASGCAAPSSQPPAWPQPGSTLIRGLW
ncbi:MAG: Occludin/ELL family protein [Vulcanococcus sp.]